MSAIGTELPDAMSAYRSASEDIADPEQNSTQQPGVIKTQSDYRANNTLFYYASLKRRFVSNAIIG